MAKRVWLSRVFLVVSLVLAAIFLSGPVSYAKTYTIAFQMSWHTKHPEYCAIVNPHRMVKRFSKDQALLEMLKKAAAEKGYKLRFIVYPADQLVKRKMALDALKDGTIDMLASCAAYYHGTVPEGDIDWMPYTATIVGRGKTWDFLNHGEMAKIKRDAYLKKANAFWITNVLCGSSCVLARGSKPFKSLEDLKGKKIRCAGGLATRIGVALGVSPVTLATGEIYPALQRGVLDGLLFYVYGLRDYMLVDYCKALTFPPMYIWNDELWINKDKFYSLPKDLQDIFIKVSQKWARWASTEYWPAYEEELTQWAKKRGVVFYTLSKAEQERWRKAIEPIWSWYAHGSKGCAREVELLKAFVAENAK